ncbi:tetratricopeptide repeat protein [Lachnoanaerobaculum gingivalis]
MDKYEFNLKVEQLNKLVKSGDYKAAMRITDTIDWSRVHNAGLLTTVSEVYEKNDEYKEAREVLLLAYDRAPVGKRALYRLTMLAIKEGDIAEAEAYYREYIEISPQDSRKYLMEYHIAVAKGEDIHKKIRILEKYSDIEKMDEQWKYELAQLYAQAGRIDDCIKTCDEIMLLFGVGEYVEKAAALKESTGCPLSSKQQEQVDNKEFYEDRLNSLVKQYESENYPNLNLDDMSAYKPREEKRTTISLIDEEESPNEDASINTELFPKTVGVNEIRISETTFKGENVNPEFEIELKRAIAITNENLNKMKTEGDHASMREIDEEVRAHMERVERIKQGRFNAPPVMGERRKSRISNHFDSMGLPKTHGSRDEREGMDKVQNTWISDEEERKSPDNDDTSEESHITEPVLEDTVSKAEQTKDSENIKEQVEELGKAHVDEAVVDESDIKEEKNDKIDLININTNNSDVFQSNTDQSDEDDDFIEEIPDELPVENITVTETASTKVLENYVPEKKNPIFDKDDLINSYFDDEIDMGVPTVSSVMAKRKEQKDVVQSSIKSETTMEVVDDEEIYYTKEERTFVTKVKKGEEPEEIFIEPEYKEVKAEDEGTVMIEETDIQEDATEETTEETDIQGEAEQETEEITKSDSPEDDEEGDTVVIEESVEEAANDESREVDLPVHGKVMKAKAPKSREPKEYLMRRPGSIMVEGITGQKALENAIEVLREVNELTKIKHTVLKIKAKSLNAKGVMNSIDKIKGKDLIIVEAGYLDDNTIAEIIEFIRDGKETVVFADTIEGIANLIEANDLLHGMSLVMREEEVPVKRKNIVANIELKDKAKEPEKEESKEAQEKAVEEVDTEKEPQSTEELSDLEIIANILKKEYGEDFQFEMQEITSSDSITFHTKNNLKSDVKEEEKETIKIEPIISQPVKKEDKKEDKEVEKAETTDEEPAQIEEKEDEEAYTADEEEDGEDNAPMDVDDFINYALSYAKEIECVLYNKAKYAVEERADYMKEDKTPLTRKNARNLIDHAADLAERPGVVKAIFGFMNPKYDKEGRLILREEHFRI